MGLPAMVAFLLIGGLFAGMGWVAMLGPELEVNRRFVPGRCTLLAKELVEEKSSRGTSGRRRAMYRPEFQVRHEVAGRQYEARTFRITRWATSDSARSQDVLARHEVGRTYPCWYDPADPSRVVLEKGTSVPSWLFTGVGAALASVGAVGVGKRLGNVG